MAAALDMAGRIREALEKSFRIEDTPLAIEARIGIALYPEHADKALALIQHADVAMRQARDEKSGMRPYDAGHDPFNMRRLTMFRDLREALQQGKLSLHYQPKVELKSGRVVGVEALARWQSDGGEHVSPAEFVPLAEQTGLIRPLGLWVLAEAVSQCGRWQQQGMHLGMAINVSTWNLLDTSLPDRVVRLLDRWNVEATSITLEITESAIMEYPETAVDVLVRLRKLGLGLSVDDFGTGHSSLAYLKSLPVNELKIDQHFVFDMTDDRTDRAIVRSTIDLAHELGLGVTAEGVEDARTYEALRHLACDQAQGFYISRALPPDTFVSWLQDRNR
jgi:EAL domain-containing protein (putative c-di-GMP-specific phosphodiesterase class I)